MEMAFGLIAFFVLVFAVLFCAVGVMTVASAVNAWLGPREEKADPYGHCGACGYSTRGLQSDVCPECGADLREVGRIYPHADMVRDMVGLVVVLTIAVLAILAFGAIFVGAR